MSFLKLSVFEVLLPSFYGSRGITFSLFKEQGELRPRAGKSFKVTFKGNLSWKAMWLAEGSVTFRGSLSGFGWSAPGSFPARAQGLLQRRCQDTPSYHQPHKDSGRLWFMSLPRGQGSVQAFSSGPGARTMLVLPVLWPCHSNLAFFFEVN